MRKFLVVLFVLFAASVYAQQAVRLDVDGNGTKVDANHPLPVTIAGIIQALEDIKAACEAISGTPSSLPVAEQTSTSVGTAAITLDLDNNGTPAKEITIFIHDPAQQVWLSLGGNDPAVGAGAPINTAVFIDKLNASEVVKLIASETVPFTYIIR